MRIFVSAVFISMLALFSCSESRAAGFEWFFAHRHPSGQCSSGREVAASNYSGRHCASGRCTHDTIASWDYPFGTRIRVTNPFTGLTAIGVVRDRGPSRHRYNLGVKLDLWDHLAAQVKLGIKGRRESGWVCMEVL